MKNNERDIWSGLSYFLAEMIEKYVVGRKFRRKKIINIDYCYS